MIVFSERVVYVGAHVTPEAKRALREIAQTQHVSMSAFIAEAIQEKLEKVTRETHEGNSHSSAA